ncbi:hypothetical protein SEVIR_1G312800v4 [Setaria viridis]|uniref:Aldehyde dehydrogenase domain-containing protein n=1 Tax=Setaria italica TaxID=4555 RepID=K3YS90_SETIT
MAARRAASSILSRCLIARSSPASASSPAGKSALLGAGALLHRFSTAPAAAASPTTEEPIQPAVEIKHTQLLINGNFVDAASGKTFPTLDPRTGEVIARVAEGDSEDIDRAVAAARKAFDEGPWPRMTAYERCRVLLRFADLIERHADEIAALETWDNGKTLAQSAGAEVPMLARCMRYYAGWADKIHGLVVPADGAHHVQVLHEPVGVAGQIIPWNFPLLMFAWKVGPALACGNAVVLKTAEQTPLSALYVASLLHEAGLPDGVLNVVSGFGPTAGAALCSHMGVDKLAFTGSTGTGQIVLELAARSNLKPVTLELGGKSPFIVMDDADVDQAVELAHHAVFFNQVLFLTNYVVLGQLLPIMKFFANARANAAARGRGRSCTSACTTSSWRSPRPAPRSASSATPSGMASSRGLRSTRSNSRKSCGTSSPASTAAPPSSPAATGRAAGASTSSRPCSPTPRTK